MERQKLKYRIGLRRLTQYVVDILRREFRDPALQIYGRAKDIDSLLKKLILKPEKTYQTLTDKAGVRVVVKFTEEIDIVGRFIETRFTEHVKDDKRAKLK